MGLGDCMITGIEIFCDSIEDLKVGDIVSDCSFINDFNDIFFLNTAFYNLESESFDFRRGAMTNKDYYRMVDDGDDGQVEDLYIREHYEYTYSADLRSILSVDRKVIEYFKRTDDGSLVVGMRKTIPKKQRSKKLEEINRTIRYGQLDFMTTSAKEMSDGAAALPSVVDLPTVQYLSANGLIPLFISSVELYNGFRNGLIEISNGIYTILDHYQNEIYKYKENGTMEFENAVNSELDPDILKILNDLTPIQDPQFPNGLTVIGAINYQLAGVVE
jgi:hypothetical protein